MALGSYNIATGWGRWRAENVGADTGEGSEGGGLWRFLLLYFLSDLEEQLIAKRLRFSKRPKCMKSQGGAWEYAWGNSRSMRCPVIPHGDFGHDDFAMTKWCGCFSPATCNSGSRRGAGKRKVWFSQLSLVKGRVDKGEP